MNNIKTMKKLMVVATALAMTGCGLFSSAVLAVNTNQSEFGEWRCGNNDGTRVVANYASDIGSISLSNGINYETSFQIKNRLKVWRMPNAVLELTRRNSGVLKIGYREELLRCERNYDWPESTWAESLN